MCKSVEDLAAMLSRASGKTVTPAMIKADLKAGAPKQPGGLVHLLNYTAWLAKGLVQDGEG